MAPALTEAVIEARPRFNPFPGLRPFEPEEDHLFFGREKEIDDLLLRLRDARFVSVIGLSGCGKSSLVRSGLIPSLYSGFLAEAGTSWRVAITRPGADPIGNLALSLHAVLAASSEQGPPAMVEATLRRSHLGLADAGRQANLPAGENLLVVIDQFEELFRFQRSRSVANSRDESTAFVRLLLHASGQTEVPVYVVTTMRSDFIGNCMEFPGLPEAMNTGQYLVPRMTRDELRSAIEGPVGVGGGRIAPRLVNRLLNEVGEDQDQLPVLQHALMRTWEEWIHRGHTAEPIDLEDYEAVGTMGRALSLHAEEAYSEIGSETGRRTAEILFKALTDTSAEGRGVRRPATVAEIAKVAGVSTAEVIQIADLFRKEGRTFLTPPPAVALDPSSVLDLSHESLMRSWPRLIEWAEEERRSAEFYVRLSRAAAWHEEGTAGLWRDPELTFGTRWRGTNLPNAEWASRYDSKFERAVNFLRLSEEQRDRENAEADAERRKKLRRTRQVAAALALLSVIAVSIAVVAVKSRDQALRERARADQNLEKANDAVNEMLVSSGDLSPAALADAPELDAFRGELLNKAQIFYRGFSEQKPESEKIKRQIAEGHSRLGDIHRLLDETDEALAEYGTAIELFGSLNREYPDSATYRQSLASVQNWLGELLRPLQGRAADAESAYAHALRLQVELHREFPQNPEYQQELARTHYNRGILRFTHGTGGADDYLEAIQLLTPLAPRDAPEARRDLARALNNYGTLLNSQARYQEAEQTLTRAIALADSLVQEDPRDRPLREEVSRFNNNLAISLLAQGKADEATKRNDRALSTLEQLARPERSIAVDLAHSRNQQARILDAMGRDAAAGEAYRSAVAAFRNLLAGEDSSAAELGHQYGEALFDLAEWHAAQGRLSAAATLLTEAVSQHSSPPPDKMYLAQEYLLLAKVGLAQGSRSEARQAMEKFRELLPDLAPVARASLERDYEELRTEVGLDVP